MGKRSRGKGAAKYVQGDDHGIDPSSRHLACSGSWVAIAVGPCWRVINATDGAVVHVHEGDGQPAVRALAFSPDGSMLLTGADDKVARVWRTHDWTLQQTTKGNKKISAVAWARDSRHYFFADRFGDVFAAAAPAAAGAASGERPQAAAAAAEATAQLLLGHLQAIISSLTAMPDGRLLISTDKEGKVRANILPSNPLLGSYEVQSYCMGHTNFVTCSAAACSSASNGNDHAGPAATVGAPAVDPAAAAAAGVQCVLSGAGDGTVRLWDPSSGACLATHVAAEQPPQLPAAAGAGEDAAAHPAGEQQQQEQQQQVEGQDQPVDADGGSDSDGESSGGGSDVDEGGEASRPSQRTLRQQCSAVVSVAASPCGCWVAVAVEGQQEVQLLRLDLQQPALRPSHALRWQHVANPCCVAFDATGRLWVVGGPLKQRTTSAHVGVAQRAGAGDGDERFVDCTGDALLEPARTALERRDAGEEAELAAALAAEAPPAAAGQQAAGCYYSDAFKRPIYSNPDRRGNPGDKRARWG